MFSPLGAPNDDEQDIDWVEDLKFYIDNENRLLNNYLFPAIKKHEQHVGNPNVYKLYLRAIRPCLEDYCSTFKIKDSEEKFTEDALEELARTIASEQEKHLKDGDYKNEDL